MFIANQSASVTSQAPLPATWLRHVPGAGRWERQKSAGNSLLLPSTFQRLVPPSSIRPPPPLPQYHQISKESYTEREREKILLCSKGIGAIWSDCSWESWRNLSTNINTRRPSAGGSLSLRGVWDDSSNISNKIATPNGFPWTANGDGVRAEATRHNWWPNFVTPSCPLSLPSVLIFIQLLTHIIFSLSFSVSNHSFVVLGRRQRQLRERTRNNVDNDRVHTMKQRAVSRGVSSLVNRRPCKNHGAKKEKKRIKTNKEIKSNDPWKKIRKVAFVNAKQWLTRATHQDPVPPSLQRILNLIGEVYGDPALESTRVGPILFQHLQSDSFKTL